MAEGRKSIKTAKTKGSKKGPKKGADCTICLKPIIDHSEVTEGEDSIFCEGLCQQWIHRTCAGLPDPAFDLIRSLDQNFYCFLCSMACHTSELKALRSTIESLSKDLTELRAIIETPPSLPPTVSNQMSYSEVVTGIHQQAIPPPSSDNLYPKPPAAMPPRGRTLDHLPTERKFNLIISGLAECPNGTPLATRASMDEDSIVYHQSRSTIFYTSMY